MKIHSLSLAWPRSAKLGAVYLIEIVIFIVFLIPNIHTQSYNDVGKGKTLCLLLLILFPESPFVVGLGLDLSFSRDKDSWFKA